MTGRIVSVGEMTWNIEGLPILRREKLSRYLLAPRRWVKLAQKLMERRDREVTRWEKLRQM